MDKVDKTNQIDTKKIEKKKRKWKIFWYFFGGALGITIMTLAIYYGIITCSVKQPEVITEIYQVEEIGGKVTLLGFDENVSQEEIVKELKDTLTIPKEIQVIADDAFYDGQKSTIPSEITKLDWNNAPIEKIGDNAFKDWDTLQSLTIPSGVEVGDGAFADCDGLNEIHLEGFGSNIPTNWGNNVFADENQNQGIIYIQSNLDYQAWYNYLTNQQGFIIGENNWIIVPIEKTIFDVRENVLYGFAPLITYEDIGQAFKDKILVLPEGVTTINANAFYDGTESTIPSQYINNIRFNSQLQIIGANAFKLAPFTSELSIPANVTSIDQGAFYGTDITSLTLSNELISITGASRNGAFENCPNLTSINLKSWNAVASSMGEDTFANHAYSGTIYIKDSSLANGWKTFFTTNYDFTFASDQWKVDPDVQDTVLEIDDGVLKGFYDWATEQQILEEFSDGNMVIPNTVTSVANDAFWELTEKDPGWRGTIPKEIEKITFEGLAVTSIGDRAFAFNGSIEEINLDSSWTDLKNIGAQAFFGCESLSLFNGTNVLSLPDNMTNIGAYAFASCRSIEGIKLPKIESNTNIGVSAFAFSDSLQILDFSNLEIEDGNPYDLDCSMALWMLKNPGGSTLFNGIATNGTVIMPTYSGSKYNDKKHAFLLTESTEKTDWLEQTDSAFYWICANISSDEVAKILNWYFE